MRSLGHLDSINPSFFLLILLILVISTYIIRERESFTQQPLTKTAVCFLCVCPKKNFIEFAEQVAEYHKVFIVCDKMDCDTPPSEKVTFIKIPDQECLEAGFSHSADPSFKAVIAQDKAFYYFSVVNTSYNYVWIIEDDVYIPRPYILSDIDKVHVETDLITVSHRSRKEDSNWNWWPLADSGHLQGDFHHGMACVTRLSQKMLQKIREIATKHKRLVFVEFMFNTIAANEKMSIATPSELSKIVWKYKQETEWPYEEVANNQTNLFHPIKNSDLHTDYRSRLPQVQGRRNDTLGEQE